MGCYGIGVSRVVAAAIEQNHDENGIQWPEEIAPYKVGIINMRVKDEETSAAAEKLYNDLKADGVEVLYDDRDAGAGQKFADMDLIGLPWQCVVGPRGLKEGKMEWKNRKTGEKIELPVGQRPEGI
jgi:prolyl-tRNA synthetase